VALNVGNLVATLGLDKRGFDTGIDSAQAKTRGFVGTLGSTLKKVAVPVAAVGAAIGGAAIYGVKKFADFEEQMNQVFTLLPDASAEFRDQMISDVKKISSEMGVLTEDVVPALYDALGSGVPPENVFKFLEVAQKAAVGGATNLATTVDGLTSVVNAYGSDVLDVGTASDIMFQTVNVGKATFAELAGSLYDVAPIASQLGVSFDQVGAALASMTSQGVPASVATTYLRQMLVQLSESGGKTATLFESLAGKSFREFVKSGGTMQQALQMMEEYATKTNVGINDLFGSVWAGSAALTLTGKGTEAFTSALKTMETSAGATESAYQTMESGIKRQWGKIKADFQVTVLDLAGVLAPFVSNYVLPALQGAVDAIKDLMAWFGKVSPALKPLKDTFVNTLAPAVEFFQDKLSDLSSWWGDHSSEFETYLGALNGIIQTTIEKIVQPIAEMLVPVIDFLQELAAKYFDWYMENLPIFVAAWENVAGAIGWVIETVLVPLFEWAWPYIETIVSGALQAILGIAKLFASILAGDWESASDALVDISKGGMSATIGIVSMGWDAIATGIEFVGQGILNFVYAMWDGIVQATENAINRMIDIINGFLKAINSVTEKVGISVPTLQHISLQTAKLEAPKLKIPRWAETSFGQEIEARLAVPEPEEEVEEEEDIEEEFKKVEETTTPLAPTAPRPTTAPVTVAPIQYEELPELETPTTPTEPLTQVPEIETPVPVIVENWEELRDLIEAPTTPGVPTPEPPETPEIPPVRVPQIPEIPEIPKIPEIPPIPEVPEIPPVRVPQIPEIPDKTEEQEDIDKEFESPTVPPIGIPTPKLPETPEVPPVTVPKIPETPKTPWGPEYKLPKPIPPITVPTIDWSAFMRPTPAPVIEKEDEEEEKPDKTEEQEDIDKEFESPTVPTIGIPIPKLPEIIVPEIPAPVTSTIPDIGIFARLLDNLCFAGETRVVVEVDGNAIGETLFRTWNRRTGGARNV
jgi:TP901 family phage tail tape measure protein